MMQSKKGESVWISAVLYFGIGIVLLTIILTAGMPVVDRIKDKNIATQTKDVFHNLDKTIRDAAAGGPGSQRIANLDVQKGKFTIDADHDLVTWSFESTAMLSEPGVQAQEGNIIIFTDKQAVSNVEKNILTYTLNYSCLIDLTQEATDTNTLGGASRMAIQNIGSTDGDAINCPKSVPKVVIREI